MGILYLHHIHNYSIACHLLYKYINSVYKKVHNTWTNLVDVYIIANIQILLQN